MSVSYGSVAAGLSRFEGPAAVRSIADFQPFTVYQTAGGHERPLQSGPKHERARSQKNLPQGGRQRGEIINFRNS